MRNHQDDVDGKCLAQLKDLIDIFMSVQEFLLSKRQSETRSYKSFASNFLLSIAAHASGWYLLAPLKHQDTPGKGGTYNRTCLNLPRSLSRLSLSMCCLFLQRLL